MYCTCMYMCTYIMISFVLFIYEVTVKNYVYVINNAERACKEYALSVLCTMSIKWLMNPMITEKLQYMLFN